MVEYLLNAIFSMISIGYSQANNILISANQLIDQVHITQPYKAEYKYHSVTVYYTSYCGACHDLMGKLDSLGVKYTKINIEDRNIPGIRYVPVMKVDGKTYIGDMSLSALKKALGI